MNSNSTSNKPSSNHLMAPAFDISPKDSRLMKDLPSGQASRGTRDAYDQAKGQRIQLIERSAKGARGRQRGEAPGSGIQETMYEAMHATHESPTYNSRSGEDLVIEGVIEQQQHPTMREHPLSKSYHPPQQWKGTTMRGANAKQNDPKSGNNKRRKNKAGAAMQVKKSGGALNANELSRSQSGSSSSRKRSPTKSQKSLPKNNKKLNKLPLHQDQQDSQELSPDIQNPNQIIIHDQNSINQVAQLDNLDMDFDNQNNQAQNSAEENIVSFQGSQVVSFQEHKTSNARESKSNGSGELEQETDENASDNANFFTNYTQEYQKLLEFSEQLDAHLNMFKSQEKVKKPPVPSMKHDSPQALSPKQSPAAMTTKAIMRSVPQLQSKDDNYTTTDFLSEPIQSLHQQPQNHGTATPIPMPEVNYYNSLSTGGEEPTDMTIAAVNTLKVDVFRKLHDQLEIATQQLHHKDKEVNYISAQHQAFIDQANLQREDMHRLLKKRNESELSLQNEVLLKNKTISTLTEKLRSSTRIIVGMNSKVSGMTYEYQNLLYEKMKAKGDDLAVKMEQYKKEIEEENAKEMSDLKGQVQTLTQKSDKFMKESENFKVLYNKQKEKSSQLNEQLASLQIEHGESCSHVETLRLQMSEKTSEVEKLNLQHQNHMKQVQTNLSKAERQGNAKSSEFEQIKSNLQEQLKQMVQKKDKEIQEMIKKIQEAESREQEHIENTKARDNELDRVRLEAQAKEETQSKHIQQLNSDINQLKQDTKNDRLKQEANQLSSFKQDREKLLEEKDNEIEAMRDQYDQAFKSSQEEKDQHIQIMKERTLQLETDLSESKELTENHLKRIQDLEDLDKANQQKITELETQLAATQTYDNISRTVSLLSNDLESHLSSNNDLGAQGENVENPAMSRAQQRSYQHAKLKQKEQKIKGLEASLSEHALKIEKMNSLDQRFTEVEVDNQYLKEQVDRLSSTIEVMKQNKEDQEKTIENQKEEYDQQKRELENKYKLLIQEKEGLEYRISSLENEKDQLESKFNGLQSSSSNQSEEINIYRAQIQELAQQISREHGQKTELQEQLQQKQDEINDLNAKISNLEEVEIKKLKEKNQQEADELMKQFEIQSEELHRVRIKLETLEKTTKSQSESEQALLAEANEQRSKAEEYQKKCENQEKENRQLSQDQKELLDLIVQLKKSLKLFRGFVRKQVESEQKNRRQLQRSQKDGDVDYDQSPGALMTESSDDEIQFTNKLDRSRNGQMGPLHLSQECKKIEQQNNIVQNYINDFDTNKQNIEIETTELKQQLEKMTSQYQNKEQEVGKQKTVADQLQKQIQDKEAEAGQIRVALEESCRQQQSKETENQSLRADNERLQKSVQNKESEAETMKTVMEKLQQQIGEAMTQKATTQEADPETIKKHQDNIQKLEYENKQKEVLLEALQQSVASKDNERQELQEELNSHLEENTQLKDDIKQLREEQAKQDDELMHKYQEYSKQVKSKDQEIGGYQKQIKALMESHVASSMGRQGSNKELKQMEAKHDEQLANLTVAFQGTIAKQQKEITEQKRQHDEKDSEIQNMQKMVSMKSIQIAELNTKLELSRQGTANNDLGQFFNDDLNNINVFKRTPDSRESARQPQDPDDLNQQYFSRGSQKDLYAQNDGLERSYVSNSQYNPFGGGQPKSGLVDEEADPQDGEEPDQSLGSNSQLDGQIFPYRNSNSAINKEINEEQVNNTDSLKRMRTYNQETLENMARRHSNMTVPLIDKEILNSKLYLDLQQEKASVISEKEVLQQRFNELQAQNSHLEDEVRALRQQKMAIEKEHQQIVNDNESVLSTIHEELKSQGARLSGKQGELYEVKSKLVKSRQGARETGASHAKECAELKKSIQSKDMMIAQYEKDMAQYADERAEKETQLAGLEQVVATLTGLLHQSANDGNQQTNMMKQQVGKSLLGQVQGRQNLQIKTTQSDQESHRSGRSGNSQPPRPGWNQLAAGARPQQGKPALFAHAGGLLAPPEGAKKSKQRGGNFASFNEDNSQTTADKGPIAPKARPKRANLALF